MKKDNEAGKRARNEKDPASAVSENSVCVCVCVTRETRFVTTAARDTYMRKQRITNELHRESGEGMERPACRHQLHVCFQRLSKRVA